MDNIKITFPDGSSKEFKKGITGIELAKSISEGLARNALAIQIDDKIWDLSREINHDCAIKILTFKDKEGVEVFRHSTAHILADAVMQLFPYAKPTIGPAVDEGFYYDFDHEPFKTEDLEKIEKKMQEIIKQDFKFERKEISKKDALKIFKDNQYKIEMINELKDDKITVYLHGKYADFCRGPHVQSTGQIKAIKLTKIAGAYWRGDSKNKMLQRIYGISFPDNKLLKEFEKLVEDAEKYNHNALGEQLGLFAQFDLVGKGLPIWLPKGDIIRREIENFAMQVEDAAGYVRVSTPHLAKKELFMKSGHLPYYEHSMYPCMKMDDGDYYLKAMNCPMHHLICNKMVKSYRDLPYRIAEYGTVYRNELSGTLSGLLRVRCLRMNDAHIYCTKDQAEQEIKNVLSMIDNYYKVFGLKGYSFRLSLHEPTHKEKYIDEPDNWRHAEEALRKALTELKLPFVEVKDEAAFYGPKIDVQFKNVYGREETVSTVQLDFAAKKRFELQYDDEKGHRNTEVFVVHRAPLSTHERLIALLLEQYKGRFPLWLNPVQVAILTVSEKNEAYAEKIKMKMFAHGIRVETDIRSESIGKKVRDAQLKQANYILVVGENEEKADNVAVRTREGQVEGAVSTDKFIERVLHEIKEKKL
jgi:threonyl-tRNA synthetase